MISSIRRTNQRISRSFSDLITDFLTFDTGISKDLISKNLLGLVIVQMTMRHLVIILRGLDIQICLLLLVKILAKNGLGFSIK